MKALLSLILFSFLGFCSANSFADVAHIQLTTIATSKVSPDNSNDFSTFSVPVLSNNSVSVVEKSNIDSVETLYSTYGNNLIIPLAITNLSQIPFTTQYFSSFGNLAVNSQLAVFIGTGGGSAARRQGIYSVNSSKQINMIADNTTPVIGGSGNFTTFASPYLFNDNAVAFYAKGNNQQFGIYYANSKGLLSVWLNNQTKLPQGNDNFTDIDEVAFSTKGNTDKNFVFIGTDDQQQTAIYEEKQDKLSLLVAGSDAIPDSSIGNFTKFDEVSYDAANDTVAFIGEGVLGQIGIYEETGGNLSKVVDLQDTIPEGLGDFQGFSHISMDYGMVAFEGVGNFNQQGVFLYAPQGVFKIISNSDEIGNKKVTQVNIITNYALSNNQIALRVSFADGTSGIYLANVQILPY